MNELLGESSEGRGRVRPGATITVLRLVSEWSSEEQSARVSDNAPLTVVPLSTCSK
jgi:hypothetical protein